MAASTRNLRHGSLILSDGTPVTPNTLIIPIMDGDLDFTITYPTFIVKNRGRIDHKRTGDEVEIDIKFSFKFEQWSFASGAATGISPVDALTKKGGAAAWVSSGPSCGPYSIDLIFKLANPCSTTDYEQLVFPAFNVESLNFKEGSEFDTISVAGKALAFEPTRTYVTA
jgi:hypothetical protein